MWTGPTGELTYSGLRVVELADELRGEIVGKLLADEGADVVKVEPSGGSIGRHIGPHAEGFEHDPNASLYFWTYNTGKRSVVIEVDETSGRQRFDELVAAADVLITSDGPGRLGERGIDLDAYLVRHPALIVLSVSPYGLTGPWADRRTSELVGLAAGGPLLSCGYDDHTIPPILPGGNQASQIAASFGHTGLLLALLERQSSGLGQMIDVSMHEAIAVSGELANPYWFYPRVHLHRQTCRHAQPSPTQPALFECADGVDVYFALILSDTKTWQTLVEWLDTLGLALDLADEAYLSLAHRQQNFAHIQDIMESFFLMQESADVYRGAQDRGLPLGPILAPEQLLDDPHLQAREFFVPVELPTQGEALFPSSPYRFSYGNGRPGRPPKLGEDNGFDFNDSSAESQVAAHDAAHASTGVGLV
ncbi:CoA transferase [Nocardioides sp. YIM 152315]|uniref:CaiB/BaiF CoA transferase family protein n=1 Tax=Nocardioides sp. YIM 152315 TaxID=3031760 RepID=UPI0023DA35A0|nr:CoA transferase [Nocardioides sp. YIM 152315]MDF1602238.1 CoA transferase [Nocardioides sp. YIM 152315]